jgi:hypothetical protein
MGAGHPLKEVLRNARGGCQAPLKEFRHRVEPLGYRRSPGTAPWAPNAPRRTVRLFSCSAGHEDPVL